MNLKLRVHYSDKYISSHKLYHQSFSEQLCQCLCPKLGEEEGRKMGMLFSAATPVYTVLWCLSDHSLRLPHFVSVTVIEYTET